MRDPATDAANGADRLGGGTAADGPQGGTVALRLQWLVASHLDVDPARLEPEVRLGEDLCVDSLAAIELTMVIEDEFDISLPDEDVVDVRTYGDVQTLVAARTGTRTGNGSN